ncbi:EpsG family protein [Clostridium perfringens]|uniref:EpsG family protein n=1 Tax=Clostridium perfringens TaxID=1502 RepID=UPI0024BC22EA|nr:EpsG family protein [Clostridium perfringens]
MTIFYGTIIFTYILGVLANIFRKKKFKIITFFCLISIAIILITVSGLRSNIGDTSAYMHSYEVLVQNVNSVKLDKDIGFNLLSLILTKISSEPQILIFVTALITNLLNVISFNKYGGIGTELQIYLYITSGYFLVTMNGIRQCLAAALIFICTRFLIKGNFKLYLICILLISTIHASALIIIPVYFVVRQKAWSKKMFYFILLAIIGIMLYSFLEPLFFKLLSNTQYGGYSNFNEGGSSLIRTIVELVPVFLAYIKRNELSKEWSESNIFVNMSIINFIFVAFGMYNWIYNRFTIYFQLYNFILIPYIIMKCFKKKERRLLYLLLLVCYFIFFYREQVIGMNIQYKSLYLN